MQLRCEARQLRARALPLAGARRGRRRCSWVWGEGGQGAPSASSEQREEVVGDRRTWPPAAQPTPGVEPGASPEGETGDRPLGSIRAYSAPAPTGVRKSVRHSLRRAGSTSARLGKAVGAGMKGEMAGLAPRDSSKCRLLTGCLFSANLRTEGSPVRQAIEPRRVTPPSSQRRLGGVRPLTSGVRPVSTLHRGTLDVPQRPGLRGLHRGRRVTLRPFRGSRCDAPSWGPRPRAPVRRRSAAAALPGRGLGGIQEGRFAPTAGYRLKRERNLAKLVGCFVVRGPSESSTQTDRSTSPLVVGSVCLK